MAERKKKTVWVVFNWKDFGKKDFVGVFSTKEKAWKYAKDNHVAEPRIWEEPVD